MAASSMYAGKIGGYKCEFIQPVSEDLKCALCRYVARDPHLTSCCGEHYCQVCITPALEGKKPCPSCEQAEFTTILDKRDWKKIQALEACCMMKDRGCEWTGKLEGLGAHLDVDTGDCEYVDVKCTNECDQPVEKRNLQTHLSNSCPKREFTCQYCNFKATYEIVSNDHWPQCSFYPVPCPNACGIQAIERGDVEAHLLQCPLEEVECDFIHTGCGTKLPRQDMEKHVEESTQKHMALMSAMSLRSSREFEKKLQEQRQEFEQRLQEQQKDSEDKLQTQRDEFTKALQVQNQEIQQSLSEKDQEIRELSNQLVLREREVQQQLQEKEDEIKQVREQLQEEMENKVQETRASLQTMLIEKEQELKEHQTAVLTVPPVNFTIKNFNEHKINNVWKSPFMYTHFGGYNFQVSIFLPPGDRNTALILWFSPRAGDFDDQLKWPVKVTITMQLINQYRDANHYTTTHTCEWRRAPNPSKNSSDYISNATLEWNASKQTQYRKNDQLHFQVTKVIVHVD